ncbi:MAG: class I SAM-dependent methyltransferase [Kiritimatiellales bacterium]
MNELDKIYDGIAADYERGRNIFNNTAQLEMLAEKIPAHADVLDAGCGSGIPVLKFFIDHGCRVTGTDISAEMLALAAKNSPAAELIQKDTAELDFPADSFDLITSIYTLFHMSMECQVSAFGKFYTMLRASGIACFTLATETYTGAPEFSGMKQFKDVELPYHHVTPEKYAELLTATGFKILSAEHLKIGRETMLWMLVQKE